MIESHECREKRTGDGYGNPLVASLVAPAGSGPCGGQSPVAQGAPGLTKYGSVGPLHTERWALDLLTPGRAVGVGGAALAEGGEAESEPGRLA